MKRDRIMEKNLIVRTNICINLNSVQINEFYVSSQRLVNILIL